MADLRKNILSLLIIILAFATISIPISIPLCSYGLLDQPTKLPSSLVPLNTQLQYHRGPLLTAPINIYLTWYGVFSPNHKTIISDFFASFNPSETTLHRQFTVSAWWKTAKAYKDATGKPVSSTVKLAGQATDMACSLGKALKRADLATLVRNSILKRVFPFDPNGIYLILTANDIAVDRFRMGSCGFHNTILVYPGKRAVLAHVGDPGVQCPGLCAWPFAVPAYGPPGPALVTPNGIGVDGMVMNAATVLAGAATNPLGNGYYQGDELAPLEAVTACAGIFGAGAYPGYPGKLFVNGRSNASFNTYGTGSQMYLLPAIWDPINHTCKVVA